MHPYYSSRRRFLARSAVFAALGAAACTAAATPTSAAVTAAVASITGIISDVQAMVTTGTLTAAQLTDAQTQIAALNAQVTRQANMIAYLDDFRLMLVLTLLEIPLVFLIRGAAPARIQAAE